MKPSDANYREQLVDGCGNCQYNVDVDGVADCHVCGFGENLNKNSFYDAMREEEDKYYKAGDRYFDQGDFLDKWLSIRRVDSWSICDNFEENEAPPPERGGGVYAMIRLLESRHHRDKPSF